MKIELGSAEIKTAITKYIADVGINTVNKNITIDITVGRGANAQNTAFIDITDVDNSCCVNKEPALPEQSNATSNVFGETRLEQRDLLE